MNKLEPAPCPISKFYKLLVVMRQRDGFSLVTNLFVRLHLFEACVSPFGGGRRGRTYFQANPPPPDLLGGGSEMGLSAELNEAESAAVEAYQVYGSGFEVRVDG